MGGRKRGRESEERYGYLEHGCAVDHEPPNLSSGLSYLLYRGLVVNYVGCRYRPSHFHFFIPSSLSKKPDIWLGVFSEQEEVS